MTVLKYDGNNILRSSYFKKFNRRYQEMSKLEAVETLVIGSGPGVCGGAAICTAWDEDSDC